MRWMPHHCIEELPPFSETIGPTDGADDGDGRIAVFYAPGQQFRLSFRRDETAECLEARLRVPCADFTQPSPRTCAMSCTLTPTDKRAEGGAREREARGARTYLCLSFALSPSLSLIVLPSLLFSSYLFTPSLPQICARSLPPPLQPQPQ